MNSLRSVSPSCKASAVARSTSASESAPVSPASQMSPRRWTMSVPSRSSRSLHRRSQPVGGVVSRTPPMSNRTAPIPIALILPTTSTTGPPEGACGHVPTLPHGRPGVTGIVRRVSTSRLEAFSDGEFAIAATLLILNVHADGPHLGHALPGRGRAMRPTP